jgi:hypothetical protein
MGIACADAVKAKAKTIAINLIIFSSCTRPKALLKADFFQTAAFQSA